MTERKRKTKLDFMGYARVSGALPVDLGHGPLADERMQQLALPEDQWMGGGEVDQALSDLSRKFVAEVDAGNNPINLQLGGENPELAEFMMGQMTSQEWHQCRDYLQQHWTDAVIADVSPSLFLYDEHFQLPFLQRGLTAVPKNNVALRFHYLDGVTLLDFEGVVFVQGSDVFPLFVGDLPQGYEVDDLLKVQTLEGSDSISFGRFMFDQYQVSGDLGNLLHDTPIHAIECLILNTPENKRLLSALRISCYYRSLVCEWDELMSSQSLVFADSMFKQMDFVNGFPCIPGLLPLVFAPVEFKLIN